MKTLKHKVLRDVSIQVIDQMRKIDSDGVIQDLTEAEYERLSCFDEFVVQEETAEPPKEIEPEPTAEEADVEPEQETPKPKRGRPAGSHK